MIARERNHVLSSNRAHLPMPRCFTGIMTRLRAALGEASLSSCVEAHFPALELRVNWAPHDFLRAQHPEIKQKIQAST